MPDTVRPVPARPQFHADADVDRLMAMVTALTQEVAVLRERLDTHERLLEEREILGPSAVEEYDPPAEARQDREALRRRLIASVYRPVLTMAEMPAGEADYGRFVASLEASPEMEP